ncbi:LMBR1-like membrane protein [Globomyces pollinis-pini]|nr:LMBR1-like membrane protein [Globomyces pollinis-pini]
MAINVVLLITVIVFAILVMIAAVYFVVYYQHPQDRNVAWFPKVVVVLSLSLAAFNLFLLPLDVANQQVGGNTGLPMATLTIAFYAATIGIVVLFVPFATFYYEGEDAEDSEDGSSGRSAGKQFSYAIKYMLPMLIVLVGVIGGMYFGGLGYAQINTTYLQSPLYDTTYLEANSLDSFFTFQFYCNYTAIGTTIPLTPKTPLGINESAPAYPITIATGTDAASYGCAGLKSSVSTGSVPTICCNVPVINSIVVSPIVFIVAVVTIAGWFVFSVFCGVGMATLPYDWLMEFQHRPKPITGAVYQERKKIIGLQSAILMEAYKQLHEDLKQAARSGRFERKYRALKRRENNFRKDVVILEYHFRKLEDAYRFQGGNILLQYFKFFCAILSSLLTLMWMIHIGLYCIPMTLQQKGLAVVPVSPFLNAMLSGTAEIPLLGIGLYAMFSFYLLACVIKGNAKLGMRLVFFTIHPLVMGETLMSALVFNSGIILLSSLPCAQFLTIAFGDYAKNTSNQSIFGVQISSLKGLSFGFDAFQYILLGVTAFSVLYMMYNPYKKQKENKLNFNW